MAIADTITSMQNHTSNAYDMLENGTDLTGINKNLENLSSTIFEAFLEALRTPDTLFTNLPKTSGSGSQITLNGTAYAPMRITLNPTALSQTTYTGKNLLPNFTFTDETISGLKLKNNGDGSFTITGTSETPTSWITFRKDFGSGNYFTLSPGTYTIPKMSLGIYRNNAFIGNSGGTFTLEETSQVRYMLIAYKTSSAVNETYWYQLEKGTTTTSYEPYVGGTASPNPSYPQDIHTISGNNSVVVEGKNIAYDTIYTSQKNRYYPLVNASYSIVENEYYAISVDTPNTGVYCYINLNTPYGFTRISSNYDELLDGTRKTWIVKAIATITKTNIGLISRSSATSDTGSGLLSNFQIEHIANASGSSTPYTPYVSQTNPINLGDIEYCKIGDYEDRIFRTSGKNLANFQINTLPTANTTIIDFGKDMTFDSITTSFYLNNVQYTNGSGGLVNYQKNDGTNQYILPGLYRNSSNTGMSANTTLNGQYSKTETNITFRKVIVTNYPSFTQGTLNIQVELGSTATSYEPYGSNEWYIKKNIGKVVLDGTEYWGLGTTNVFYTSDITDYATSNNTPMSNYFSGVSNVSGATDMGNKSNNTIGFINSLSNYRFYIKSTDFATETAVKNWLSTHNLIVYYALATPTYTKITGELAQELESVNRGMLSYDGTTNISQVNNDLPFTLSVSAIEDLS